MPGVLGEIEDVCFYIIQIPSVVLLMFLSELAHPDLHVFLPLLNIDLPSSKLRGSIPFGMLVQCPLYFFQLLISSGI